MCPEEPNSKLQQLFERFNRRYWRGRLPHYTVIVSDKYVGARCEKRDRIIYINPSIPPRSVPQFLLHEMAHAAVKGYAHGKLWRDERDGETDPAGRAPERGTRGILSRGGATNA